MFKPNGNQNAHYHIKRVVGKPGRHRHHQERPRLCQRRALERDRTDRKHAGRGLAEEGVKLGTDEYFVLGDNRNNSEDSRSANIGNVKKEDILGRAWFVVTPGERFGWLK